MHEATLVRKANCPMLFLRTFITLQPRSSSPSLHSMLTSRHLFIAHTIRSQLLITKSPPRQDNLYPTCLVPSIQHPPVTPHFRITTTTITTTTTSLTDPFLLSLSSSSLSLH
ncbi:hypothetical protein E2C01_057549 [Portunus trituberculatus]|uniref:Uncharacterized protein n=1 Tax=Portunus trituberculatus TaxID=210409 RepID=A0A5B7GT71_PORTR|nr:hypothetical protein [Portunus trituberculatus]